MERYIAHLLVACLLGLCQSDDELGPPPPPPPQQQPHPHCVCKPVMRLEWEPTASICNNATFDWLLQTVLSQVTRQNEDLSAQGEELEGLRSEVAERDDVITDLNAKLAEMASRLRDLQSENTKLLSTVEDHKQHRAHLAPRPRDCADVQRYGFHYSGIYTIYPHDSASPDSASPDSAPLEVFCDLTTDRGGWLVFQRRQDGSQAFDKLWADYKEGFGRIAKEFWLGNENLHLLSSQREYELRVDLTDYLGKKYYATYGSFKVDGESDRYTLHVGEYSGDAGDGLAHHNHSPFSTMDYDNDQSKSGNCAELYGGGGWWYVRCYDSNLNGLYSDRHLYETTVWYQLRYNHEPMRHTEMKIRPKGF